MQLLFFSIRMKTKSSYRDRGCCFHSNSTSSCLASTTTSMTDDERAYVGVWSIALSSFVLLGTAFHCCAFARHYSKVGVTSKNCECCAIRQKKLIFKILWNLNFQFRSTFFCFRCCLCSRWDTQISVNIFIHINLRIPVAVALFSRKKMMKKTEIESLNSTKF